MKKLYYVLFTLLMISSVFTSCTKSPKTVLLSEGQWLIKNSDNQNLQIKDDETVSFGDNQVYNISWIEDFAFKLTWNNNDVIFYFSDYKKDKIKAAILYENEKFPETDEDWIKLQNNERVLELIKNKESEKIQDYYLINGKEVPVDKVPPAGLYLLNGKFDAINVIIKDGTVKFQAGEDKNDLEDVQATISYEGLVDGIISIIYLSNEWGSFSYVGDGVLENSDVWFNGNSGGVTKFIKITSAVQDDNNLIAEYINRTLDYGSIFKDAENSGVLVIKQFTKEKLSHGLVIKIPDGKMWTPLFYKEEDFGNNYYISIPKILTEENKERVAGRTYSDNYIYKDPNSGTWWEKIRGGYYFDEKENFKSIKFSKRNTPAITDKFAIYIQGFRENIKYSFYFFEEDIE